MGSSDSQPARPLVGDVIAGRYRIDSVAGEGGMGIVYEAEHVILRQRVAVKVLLPGALSGAEGLERFSVEASAIARISCEHVVRVMDAGTLPNGAPYLVMEYLEGENLEDLRLARGPLPITEAIDYALQTLEALAHAHAAHVVHRDLKAANLFLARLPDGRRIIKLLDFGVAMTADQYGDDERIVGSPAYMSPEQLCRDTIDARTDLWSLGVVLYELISGVLPFTGPFSELVNAILHGAPTPLAERCRAVPPELSAAVARCLERDPNARWASAIDLARALAPFASPGGANAVDRIARALANASPRGERRRYETLETALQALDDRTQHESFGKESPSGDLRRGLGATMPAPPDDAEDKLRIAMIDDSVFVLAVHSELLTTAGFAVRATSSPAELMATITEWKPHLVLMDVQMPDSGDDLCKRLKATYRATLPIVFVSMLPAAKLEAQAKASGADAFFTKTSDGEALVAFVRNICALTYSPEHLP